MESSPNGFFRNFRISTSMRGATFAIFAGILAGVSAYIFDEVVLLAKRVLLYGFAGYAEPGIIEGARYHFWGPNWIMFPLVAGGFLISSALVEYFAPTARGDGTDRIIHAYHQGKVKGSIFTAILKAITSALVIGSGGSAGKEGPISQIGGNISAYLAEKLKMSTREINLMGLAGTGAGVGAIFKAPLGGAMFAAEVLYRSAELEVEALTHIMLASISAYVVFGLFDNWQPVFATPPYEFSILHVPIFALLGLFLIPFGYLYVKTYTKVNIWFIRSLIPPLFTPLVGAVAVGLCISLVPAVSSDGYGWVQEMLNENLTWKALLAFALLKMVATSFTLGSGASGGLYAPTFAIGGALGGLFGILLKKIFPGLQVSTGAFVVVGMGSFFACVAKVPLASIILIAEITGTYEMLVPITTATFISFFFSGDWTIYSAQVGTKKDSPAHREDFLVDIMEGIKVIDAVPLPQQRESISPGMPLEKVIKAFQKSGRASLPVFSDDGEFMGLIYMDDIKGILYEGRNEYMGKLIKINDFIRDDIPPVYPEDSLQRVLNIFIRTGVEEVPVVSHDGDFLGTINHSELISAYERYRRG